MKVAGMMRLSLLLRDGVMMGFLPLLLLGGALIAGGASLSSAHDIADLDGAASAFVFGAENFFLARGAVHVIIAAAITYHALKARSYGDRPLLWLIGVVALATGLHMSIHLAQGVSPLILASSSRPWEIPFFMATGAVLAALGRAWRATAAR